MALGDVVNLGTRFGSGGTATYPTTLGATATAGNLLICYVCVTVAGRTCTTPAGWTLGYSSTAGSAFSCHIFWKESDGTETGETLVLSGSGGGYANIMEIDATGADLSAVDDSAEDTSNISTPAASQSTGTAVGSASTGIAVAFFGLDIGGNVSTGRAYTNSFVEEDQSDMGNTSRGGYLVALKVITGTSNETTFSHTETNEEMYGSILVFSASASFGIDSVSASINAETSFDVVVSNPAVTPTVGNIEIKFDNDLGPAATINSVTGSGPFTISATFPKSTTKQFENVTGYPLYVEVAAENDTSAAVPYDAPSGYEYVDLVSPVTTSGSILEGYSGDTPVTGDQAVYTTPTSPSSIGFTVAADGEWTLDSMPVVNQTVDRYVIQADGTVGVEDTITYDVGGGGGGDAQAATGINISISIGL